MLRRCRHSSPRTLPPPLSALLPTPLLVPLSPSSQPSLLLLPHARGPMEVNYLSVNRLVMTPRQGGLRLLALNASMAFAWSSRPPGATVNVKCNKRPVNKTEHCQTWSLVIDCWSQSCRLCVRLNKKQQIVSSGGPGFTLRPACTLSCRGFMLKVSSIINVSSALFPSELEVERYITSLASINGKTASFFCVIIKSLCKNFCQMCTIVC